MTEEQTNKERAERHAGGSPRKVESVDVNEEEAAAQAEAIRKLAQKND